MPAAPPEFLAELRAAVGADHVRAAPHELAAYAYDATGEKHLPHAVAYPATAAEVAACVRAARRHGIPLVPRGGGTNLSGGTLPIRGGLVLHFVRMQRILDIDVPNRRCRVQPGATNLSLSQALAPLGYYYAPDPSSQKVSTIGGNIAENAGGPHCLKYGVTTGHVLAIQVCTAEGELIWLGSPLEEHPGYDLPGLFCGSEATLGVVTEAVVRILPLPEGYRTALAIFTDLDACSRAVSAIIAARIIPAAMELMDRPSLRVSRESGFTVFPADAEAALVVEVDGVDADLDVEIEQIAAICREFGATVHMARDPATRAQLWAGRRSMGGSLARLSPYLWTQDVTVPRDRLAEMIRAVNALADQYGLAVATVAHAGDGNLHPAIPFDLHDPEMRSRVKALDAAIIQACVRLGGSITGEHGVGIDKLQGMELAFTPGQLDYMHRVRLALDPDSLMNPGKNLPMRRGGF